MLLFYYFATGVNEETALLLDTNTGDVEAVGFETAYVCLAKRNPDTTVCQREIPLTIKGHFIRKLNYRS